MTSDSTQTAGETGKPDKGPAKSKDSAAPLAISPADLRSLMAAVGRLEAEVASLRAELAEAKMIASAGADASEAAAAYMRVLLPEQYLALKPDEVRQIHAAAPEARLKLTADFVTGMVLLRRGEVIEAGDPRVPLYADRMQLALVVGGEDAGERVAELVARANEKQVAAIVEQKRREQQRVAEHLAAQAKLAADRAAALAQGAA